MKALTKDSFFRIIPEGTSNRYTPMCDTLISQVMLVELRSEVANKLGFGIESVQATVVKDPKTMTPLVRVGISAPAVLSNQNRRECNNHVCTILKESGFEPALTSFVIFDNLPTTA